MNLFILQVNSWSGGLEIGVVDCDPLHFEFPSCAVRIQSGSWVRILIIQLFNNTFIITIVFRLCPDPRYSAMVNARWMDMDKI